MCIGRLCGEETNRTTRTSPPFMVASYIGAHMRRGLARRQGRFSGMSSRLYRPVSPMVITSCGFESHLPHSLPPCEIFAGLLLRSSCGADSRLPVLDDTLRYRLRAASRRLGPATRPRDATPLDFACRSSPLEADVHGPSSGRSRSPSNSFANESSTAIEADRHRTRSPTNHPPPAKPIAGAIRPFRADSPGLGV